MAELEERGHVFGLIRREREVAQRVPVRGDRGGVVSLGQDAGNLEQGRQQLGAGGLGQAHRVLGQARRGVTFGLARELSEAAHTGLDRVVQHAKHAGTQGLVAWVGEQLVIECGQLVLHAAELANGPFAQVEQLGVGTTLVGHRAQHAQQSFRILELDGGVGELGGQPVTHGIVLGRLDRLFQRAEVALAFVRGHTQVLERREQQLVGRALGEAIFHEGERLLGAAEGEQDVALVAQLRGGELGSERESALLAGGELPFEGLGVR